MGKVSLRDRCFPPHPFHPGGETHTRVRPRTRPADTEARAAAQEVGLQHMSTLQPFSPFTPTTSWAARGLGAALPREEDHLDSTVTQRLRMNQKRQSGLTGDEVIRALCKRDKEAVMQRHEQPSGCTVTLQPRPPHSP